jgi:hypothetical protein
MTQNLSQGRNIRTVVDGQQRLRTILSFISGDFKVSRAHNKELANLTFDELPDAIGCDATQSHIHVQHRHSAAGYPIAPPTPLNFSTNAATF